MRIFLLWKTPADRKSFEIIKTLAIRSLHLKQGLQRSQSLRWLAFLLGRG